MLEECFKCILINGIIIFILSCAKNILLCSSVFAIHKKIKKIKFKNKSKLVFFACLSDIIAFIIVYLINLGSDLYVIDFTTLFFNIFVTIAGSPMYYKCIGVLIGMLCIFLFDYFIVFRKLIGISPKNKIMLSIIFAVLNSPYLYLLDINSITEKFYFFI